MQFGMFYEIQVPKPWHETKEFETYQQVLDPVQLADELGFDTFWTVEHHFLTEFSHCSAPEVLYGAISQRTKRGLEMAAPLAKVASGPPARTTSCSCSRWGTFHTIRY